MSKDDVPGGRTTAREPLDLPLLRQWLSTLAAGGAGPAHDGRHRLLRKAAKSGRPRRDELKAVSDTLAGSLGKSPTDDTLRGLLALGIVQYVKLIGQVPKDAKAEDSFLDVTAFALWSVAQAPDLPADWEETLARLVSPRMAAFVADLRNAEATRDRRNFAVLYRMLASSPVTQATRNLLEDLSDPRRGGAVLVSLALAADLPEPDPRHGPKAAAIWVLAGLSTSAVAAEGGHLADSVNHEAEKIWDALIHEHHTHGSASSHGSTLAEEMINDILHHHH
jgi:hypothetical protein